MRTRAMPNPQRTIGDWATLGSGTFGTVTYAKVTTSVPGQAVELAIKWIRVRRRESEAMLGVTETMSVVSDEEDDEDEEISTLHRVTDELLITTLLSRDDKSAVFPRVYCGLFLHSMAPSSDIPQPLQALLEEDEAHPNRRYYMAMSMELANKNTLFFHLIRGRTWTLSQATSLLFELLWGFMVATGQRGLLWHGDISASNIGLATRHANASTPVRYGLQHLDNDSLIGNWIVRESIRPLVLDFGFARPILPDPLPDGHVPGELFGAWPFTPLLNSTLAGKRSVMPLLTFGSWVSLGLPCLRVSRPESQPC